MQSYNTHSSGMSARFGMNTAALEEFIKSSPPLAATRVMTGLQLATQLQRGERLRAQGDSVNAKQDLYRNRFCGCALAGTSRAERAPHQL